MFHKYYKRPRAAFTKGLEEDVEGEGDICWTKFIPFTDGESKNVRHHLVFLMRNQQKVTPERELKPFGCGVIQIWPADVPLVPAERSLCFVKQPVARSSPGLWALLSDSALVTANLNKSLPTLSQSSYKTETTHKLEITSWNPNETAQDLIFMTFSLRRLGLFRQSRADASRRQVCFRATHCSNTPGPAVHFHFRLCNSSTFQATPQCHSVFFSPNSAGKRELILLCYFEIHAAYVNYGACWGFQGIFQAVRSAQVIQNDRLKLFFALSVVLPPQKIWQHGAERLIPH